LIVERSTIARRLTEDACIPANPPSPLVVVDGVDQTI
jgi:hypothetical protein